MEQLFRLDEIEAATRRKVVTLRRDIREGRLKATRINRQVRVSLTALNEFLSQAALEYPKSGKGPK